MDVSEAIKTRQSIRDYKSDSVPEEKLLRVLEAARLAPSAANRQQWKFIVVQDGKKREALARAANNQGFIAQAPVIIVAVATEPERMMPCDIPNYAVDLAIAIDHMTLAAAGEGLGTCWIGAFSQEKVKEVIGIPERYKVVTLFPLGFARSARNIKIRKALEEIVCYEVYKG
jgi:nitroreductase